MTTTKTTTTIRVKGIYNGKTIELLEAVTIPPDTVVEVLVPEVESHSDAKEQEFMEQLVAAGMITNVSSQQPDPTHFEPVYVIGEPISETIIKERQ